MWNWGWGIDWISPIPIQLTLFLQNVSVSRYLNTLTIEAGATLAEIQYEYPNPLWNVLVDTLHSDNYITSLWSTDIVKAFAYQPVTVNKSVSLFSNCTNIKGLEHKLELQYSYILMPFCTPIKTWSTFTSSYKLQWNRPDQNSIAEIRYWLQAF